MEKEKLTNFRRLLIIQDVANRYEIDEQMDMMVEKCGGLIVAIENYKRKRETEEELVEELADVWIMLVQIALFFGQENVNDEVDRKLVRINRVINELKNN